MTATHDSRLAVADHAVEGADLVLPADLAPAGEDRRPEAEPHEDRHEDAAGAPAHAGDPQVAPDGLGAGADAVADHHGDTGGHPLRHRATRQERRQQGQREEPRRHGEADPRERRVEDPARSAERRSPRPASGGNRRRGDDGRCGHAAAACSACPMTSVSIGGPTAGPLTCRKTPVRVDRGLPLLSRASRSPDGIRTRATALRGRRARPLHNGAVSGAERTRHEKKPYREGGISPNRPTLP